MLVDALAKTVRPLVTLAFASAITAGWLLGRLSDDAFLGVASMAIAFWFQRREEPSGNGKAPEPPKS